MAPLSIVDLLTFVPVWFTFGLGNMRPMRTADTRFVIPAAITALILLCLVGDSARSQETDTSARTRDGSQYSAIFDDVRQGISSGNVSLFAMHFAPQVVVSLRDDETGTFSANQTYYVLQNYLKLRRLAHFEFTTIGESEGSPYATGEAECIYKGSRELVQVYVALSFMGEKYVITQLNVY